MLKYIQLLQKHLKANPGHLHSSIAAMMGYARLVLFLKHVHLLNGNDAYSFLLNVPPKVDILDLDILQALPYLDFGSDSQ